MKSINPKGTSLLCKDGVGVGSVTLLRRMAITLFVTLLTATMAWAIVEVK
jgi:hypothetical protein